jgi:hypothetical protein
MHCGFYTLDENFDRPVPCDSMLEYSAWLGTLNEEIRTPVGYIVGKDSLDDCEVSTVYLGIDHSFRGEHVLWETMVFGGESDMYQERYTSHADAVAGHARVCDAVRAGEIL